MILRGILVLDGPSHDQTEIAASLTSLGCEVRAHPDDGGGLQLVGDYPLDLLVLEEDREDTESLSVRAVVSYDGRLSGPTIHMGNNTRWPRVATDRIAQIHKVLGRLSVDPVRSKPPFRLGDLVLDFDTRRANRGEDEIPLTRREFEVLAYLAERAGKWRSVKQILDAVWGDKQTPESAASLWTHVRRLRKKIEPDPRHPTRLIARPRLGYCVPASDTVLMPQVAA
jgi:two-component system, OmpR family, alkaline phosphatase synthesis response regulator PhoP